MSSFVVKKPKPQVAKRQPDMFTTKLTKALRTTEVARSGEHFKINTPTGSPKRVIAPPENQYASASSDNRLEAFDYLHRPDSSDVESNGYFINDQGYSPWLRNDNGFLPLFHPSVMNEVPPQHHMPRNNVYRRPLPRTMVHQNHVPPAILTQNHVPLPPNFVSPNFVPHTHLPQDITPRNHLPQTIVPQSIVHQNSDIPGNGAWIMVAF